MPQAAPPAPSAPIENQKPKGAIGIWIGVVVIIAGIVLGIVLVVSGAKSLLSGFDDLQRVPIAGGGVVRVEEAGTQTIYAERPATGSGTSFSTSTYGSFGPDVAVRVTGPGGDEVNVNRSVARETYTYDGREGVSVGTFYASTPGTYRVITQPQDQSSWNTIAVGSALELSGIAAILGGVFGGGFVVLIGIVIVIVFAIRRSRSKKRLVQAASPYPGSYGGGGGGWPAAPGYAVPGYAVPGYAAPGAPGGYGAPGAPAAAPGSWPPADNPGWAPPPVVHPGPANPGPAWTSPQSPPPQQPPTAPPASSDATWTPPATSDAPPPPPPPPPGDGSAPS